MDPAPQSAPDLESDDKYCALLQVAEAVATHGDLTALCRDLAHRLPSVVRFEFIGFLLHDAERDVMRVHELETSDARTLPSGIELPVDQSAGGWVWKHQQPLIIPCINEESRFQEGLRALTSIGVASFCMFPLTTVVRRLGAIWFGSRAPCAFGEKELAFLERVAKLVAVAVDNVLNFERAEAARQELTRERDRLRVLLDINNAVVATLDLRSLITEIATALRRMMPHDRTGLLLYDTDLHRFRLHALDFPGSKGFLLEGYSTPVDGTPAGIAWNTRSPVYCTEEDLAGFESDVGRRLLSEGIKSVICLPLLSHDRMVGVLTISSLSEKAFSQADMNLLSEVAKQIALAVDNALAYQQIADLKERLAKEKLYLEEEIRTQHNFEEIVGESAALTKVLKQIEIVAPTDSTVLILGETGTGKELIARALHNLSGRRARTFIKMNCAAIPTGLLESELFGHEKGAFTGAIAVKVGRFELADGGTLFLDEVGDIPLELQSKLLRVLQEQEFERLGSTRTIRVNVRVVAATNRSLLNMVNDRTFRSDLYYRLNVFPVSLPPLRERPQDIPVLVRHFAQKFARQMSKQIHTISTETMAALSRYSWPGNVRELENLIERAIILSQGAELVISPPEIASLAPDAQPLVGTLEEAEREHILRALRESNWVIGGRKGAASVLGMKRTTLQSKMQRLGVSRPGADRA